MHLELPKNTVVNIWYPTKMLRSLHVESYRSIKDVWMRLQPVNVIVGANASGKSNLYRALYLVACAANGQLARVIAEEGGMASAMWAGSHKGPARITIKVVIDNLKYELEMGLPIKSSSAFGLDPEIKREAITFIDGKHKSVLLERQSQTIHARDVNGKRITFPGSVNAGESVLSGLRQPHLFPEISALRQEILSWRFYHQFRTDAASPLRQSQIGVRTPVLAHDGSDLGAALQTIIEIGNRDALDSAIQLAFPGAALFVQCDYGRFTPALLMPGFDRPFVAAEMSDGTLHYLCLVAALLSCREPALIALNEPETSIHPDLFESLSRLIEQSSRNSQIWITTHSQQLADFLLEFTGATPLELYKQEGATKLKGVNILGEREEEQEESVL